MNIEKSDINNPDENEKVLGPHLKLWAVSSGPSYEVLPNGEDSWFLEIVASGPDSHEEVRPIRVFFLSVEDAQKTKQEIDYAPEPLIKELSDED